MPTRPPFSVADDYDSNASSTQKPEKILVVEDDTALLSELSEAIELSGFAVATASGAEAAISLVKKDAGIRVVITDISLGDISGIELIRKLSKLRRTFPLKFMVISGNTTIDNTLSALRLGAVDFIPKPIIIDELIDSLRGAIDRLEHEISPVRQLSPTQAADLLLMAGKQRASIFGEKLFDDPAWNMMVDLYSSTLKGRITSVKDLCIASGSTNTTALRRLSILYEVGLIERVRDDTDHRRVLVRPTEAGMRAMSQYSDWLTRGASG